MSGRTGIVSLISLVLASAVLGGCLITASTRRSYDGVVPSDETIKEIEIGKTTVEWLIAVAGKPSSREKVDDHTELLRYEKTATVDKSFFVFLLMQSRVNTSTRETVVFEVVDGVVTKCWAESAELAATHKLN